jgi:hypothetical protein
MCSCSMHQRHPDPVSGRVQPTNTEPRSVYYTPLGSSDLAQRRGKTLNHRHRANSSRIVGSASSPPGLQRPTQPLTPRLTRILSALSLCALQVGPVLFDSRCSGLTINVGFSRTTYCVRTATTLVRAKSRGCDGWSWGGWCRRRLRGEDGGHTSAEELS